MAQGHGGVHLESSSWLPEIKERATLLKNRQTSPHLLFKKCKLKWRIPPSPGAVAGRKSLTDMAWRRREGKNKVKT